MSKLTIAQKILTISNKENVVYKFLIKKKLKEETKKQKGRKPKVYLSENEKKECYDLYLKGFNISEIGRKKDCSQSTMHKIISTFRDCF
jgi:hypothetical protein